MQRFKYLGIIAITIFSFFYTEKIANLVLENNSLYKKIENVSSTYNVEAVNAIVDGDYITPGLTGKKVSLKDSYYNMQGMNSFNEYYLIFDLITPDTTLENNKNKIINKGNNLKNEVSFIIPYQEEIINYFHENNIDASILITKDKFNKNETLEQINNDYNNYNSLDTLLNKYNLNTSICYLETLNKDICKNKYLVKSNNILSNKTFINIKNNISSGDIYLVSDTIDIKNLKLVINSILYKDLDIVRLSKLLSEKRE